MVSLYEMGFVLIAFVFLDFLYINFKPGQPPGPWKIPFFGSLHVVLMDSKGKTGFEIYDQMSKVYGPIFQLKLGMINSYVISDYELQKQGMSSEDLMNRHQHPFTLLLSNGKNKGIIWNTGNEWREVRRYTVSLLKNFGFGKNASMDSIMESEFSELKRHIVAKLDGQTRTADLCFDRIFAISTLNVIWSWFAGERFENGSDEAKRLLNTVHEMTHYTSAAASAVLAFPFLRHVFPPLVDKIVSENKKIMQFGYDLIERKRKAGTYRHVQNDFIDAFLDDLDKNDGKKAWMYDEQLVIIISDMIFGGSETASLTLEFAVMALILNPEVQGRMRQEIDLVVGNGRVPTYSDSKSMPYCHAVILEASRLANPIPNVDRMNLYKDTKLGGYTIPKGSSCYFNTYGYHLNSKYWDKPRKFKPERFLDANNRVINSDKLLAFGHGKRLCIGELVGKASVFTFLAGLVQSFKLEAPPGVYLEKNWLKFDDGLIVSTKPYTGRIVLRDV